MRLAYYNLCEIKRRYEYFVLGVQVFFITLRLSIQTMVVTKLKNMRNNLGDRNTDG